MKEWAVLASYNRKVEIKNVTYLYNVIVFGDEGCMVKNLEIYRENFRFHSGRDWKPLEGCKQESGII